MIENPTIGNSDKINRIKPLIEELIKILDKNFTEQIRHRIKIKLENYHLSHMRFIASFLYPCDNYVK